MPRVSTEESNITIDGDTLVLDEALAAEWHTTRRTLARYQADGLPFAYGFAPSLPAARGWPAAFGGQIRRAPAAPAVEMERANNRTGGEARRRDNQYSARESVNLPTQSGAADLARLAAEIQTTFQQAAGHLRPGIKLTFHLGDLLNKARDIVPHGQWAPWIRNNFQFTTRTASEYMAAASASVELRKRASDSDWSLRQFLRVLRGRQKPSEEYYTPSNIIERARRVLGKIDLDPASCAEANIVVRAERYFARPNDGLKHPWHGRVWLNPPYCGEAGAFIKKLIHEFNIGHVTAAITLLNFYRTDTPWFQPLFDHMLCFIHGRIRFYGPKACGPSQNNSVIGYLGPDRDFFYRAFSELGSVVCKYQPDERR